MGTLTGQNLVDRITTILQDTTSVRWPVAELLNWINDGQREVVLYKPESSIANTSFTLTITQAKQTLPAAALRLIDVIRNITSGKAIRLIAREVLDAQIPDWYNSTAAADIRHFVYDTRDPKNFYVYPRPVSASAIELIYSTAPADLASIASVISVDDLYANAIMDFVLYRAYLKDAAYAGNAQRAIGHYQAFANAMGIKGKMDVMMAPQSSSHSNPNVVPGQPVATGA